VVVDPSQHTASEDAPTLYSRWRPRLRVAHEVGWMAAWLIGGGIALATGHRDGGLVGLIGGGFFAALSLVGWLRHRHP
jgi:hypothetical protein